MTNQLAGRRIPSSLKQGFQFFAASTSLIALTAAQRSSRCLLRSWWPRRSVWWRGLHQRRYRCSLILITHIQSCSPASLQLSLWTNTATVAQGAGTRSKQHYPGVALMARVTGVFLPLHSLFSLSACAQLPVRQRSVDSSAVPLPARHAGPRQRIQRHGSLQLMCRHFVFCSVTRNVFFCKASGKARLIAGMEEEEFKGDVTDACVIDRGNGEYQVGLVWRSSCSLMFITHIQPCCLLFVPVMLMTPCADSIQGHPIRPR
jgi:hypothetical protein